MIENNDIGLVDFDKLLNFFSFATTNEVPGVGGFTIAFKKSKLSSTSRANEFFELVLISLLTECAEVNLHQYGGIQFGFAMFRDIK